MNTLCCYNCKGKFTYNNTKFIDMAYKGVMMKPGRSYCIAKGKAKLIKNEFSPQSFCPKAAMPHYVVVLSAALLRHYDSAANFKVAQILSHTPFNVFSDIEYIEEWLADYGVTTENDNIICIIGKTGVCCWKNVYGCLEKMSYFNLKAVQGLPKNLLKYL